jgi:hypothetical protein
MPVYFITNDSFRTIAEASFAGLKLKKCGDLQRMLCSLIHMRRAAPLR